LLKRLICFITVNILVIGLTACNNDKSKDTGSSGENIVNSEQVLKYVEEEIEEIPELIKPGSAQINSKNQLVIQNAEAEKPEFLMIGDNGKVQDTITCDFDGQSILFAMDPQDNFYIVSVQMTELGIEQNIYRLDPHGKLLETITSDSLSLNGSDSYKKTVTGIAVDAVGNIFLSRVSGSILMLDSSGKEQRTFGGDLYKGTAQTDRENNLIIYGLDTANYQYTLQKFNTATGKNIWSKTIDRKVNGGISFSGDMPKLRCDPQDGSIYLLSDSGIEKFDTKGNRMEKALAFKEHTILASGFIPTDMCVDSQKTFYMTAMPLGVGGIPLDNSSSGFELYKYSLREIKEEDRTPISLSVPSSSRLIDVAVSKFNKANPGYRITVQEAGTGKAGDEDYERYVNTLNTELMTGKGPDIISVAGLPYEKYISKNIFADLTQKMADDNEFQQECFHMNLLDAMKYDGKLYSMPICFSLNALFPNQKALSDRNISFDHTTWTWDDFQSIVDRISMDEADDVYIVPPNVSCIAALEVLLQGSYGRFVDIKGKKAFFDSEEFVKMLEMANKFGSETPEYENQDPLESLFEAAQRGTVIFCPQSISDFMMLSTMKVLYGSGLDIVNLPGSDAGKTGGSFSCGEIYSINSNSKNKEKAWEFIKILLSEEIQGMDELSGFSVSKTALKARADRNNTLLSSDGIWISVGVSGGEPVTPKALTGQEVARVEEYVENLSSYSHIDRKVMEIIQTETKGYFNGKKNAEETAKSIQNRVNIYLGE